MNKISYYDLLGLIQREQEPKRIEISLTSGTSEIYKAEYDGGEFSHYLLEKKLQNETYRFYLGECLLESSMFDKCITILDEEEDEFIDIEEINGVVERDKTLPYEVSMQGIVDNFNLLIERTNLLIRNQRKILERLKDE